MAHITHYTHWAQQHHLTGHDIMHRVGNVLHDKRFWGTAVIVAAVLVFVGLLLWLGQYAEPAPLNQPYRYYPYLP